MLEWIASELSPEQQKPFERTTINASILAAAGSGKTRTLVHLLAADLAAGVPAASVVAFTFTEKAAEELLARIHLLARQHFPDIDLTGMYVGTIHGWCFQYLLKQSDYYNLTALDELHVDSLVSRFYNRLRLESAYGKAYPRAIGQFLADVEVFYNEYLTIEQVPDRIRESLIEYLNLLRGARLVTFGGMVRQAIDHLQQYGAVAGLQRLYVDEYQDVNPAQVALIKAMLPESGRLVVVGDDLQCIYNWRGSDVTRILKFPAEFLDVSVHRLSTNYRARPGIVRLGNQVAENIKLRDPKKVMRPDRPESAFDVVHWVSLGSEGEQVQAVMNIVQRLHAQGVPWNRMAVLFRSVMSWAGPLVDAMEDADIPVQCPFLSRGGEFVDQFLLPVFDWLRQEHPEPRNEAEEEETEKAADALSKQVQAWVTVPDGENVFWTEIWAWYDLIQAKMNEAYNIRERLYGFLDACGVRVAPEDYNLMMGLGIASQIIRSVEEIHRRRISGESRRTPQGLMSEVYYALRRKKDEFGESTPIDKDASGVVVTTIHQAKGLEWPVVILPMLVQRRFPVSNKGHGTSFSDDVAARYGTTVEDERRLFYVAATRARERLFLLDPRRDAQGSRSVFLTELQDAGAIHVAELSEIDPAVWHLDADDMKEPDQPPLRIGLSDLLIYLECPYEYGLRRVAGIRPPVGDELGYGLGLHEVIQRRLEAETAWAPDDVRMQVEEHVSLPYMSEKGEAQSRTAIERRINTLEALDVFGGTTESEVNVEVLLGAGLIHGIVDGVQINGDGSVTVRDWKANIHDGLWPRYERQLQFYTYALRQQGRVVREADVVDVAATESQGRLVARPVDVSANTVASLVGSFENALSEIAAGSFPATPGPVACASCDVARVCAHRWGL